MCIINSILGQQLSTDTSLDSVQETVPKYDEMSKEDCASDILRCHYGSVSQSLQDPVSVARLLHGEKTISQDTLTSVESTRRSPVEKRTILLTWVRGAVHTNYCSLWVFGSVLQNVTGNISLGRAILEDNG